MKIQKIKSSFGSSKYFDESILNVDCGEISMLGDFGTYTDPKTGEVIEHLGDVCNLGSLNLVGYFDLSKEDKFDWGKFKNDIRLIVRGLDNLIDLSGYPLELLKNSAKLRRKIGAGLTGFGSLMMMMGIRYGSQECLDFIDKMMGFYANEAYLTSSELAKEKGSFPLFDKDRIFNNGYIKNSKVLREDVLESIRKYGLRNSQLMTVAPNGTLSIFAGCVSGGLEPVFDKEYDRWAIVTHKKDVLLAGKEYPDWEREELKETKDFKLDYRGEYPVLISNDGTLMIDKSRGLTQKTTIKDFGWIFAKEYYEKLEPNDKRYSSKLTELLAEGIFDCAEDLEAKQHLDVFNKFSKYIDMSVSKTVNLPNDYPIEDFYNLFIEMYKNGGRGITTYRAGTMIAVLETKKENKKEKKNVKKEQKDFFEIWKEHEKGQVIFDEIKLPSEYPQMGYKIQTEGGQKFYVSIAFKDKKMTRPFAIFVNTNKKEPTVITNNAIELLIELGKSEGILSKFLEELANKTINDNNVNKTMRYISLLLRHNVAIEKIVKTLDMVEGITPANLVYRINKLLMKYVDDMENGLTCSNCGGTIRLTEGCLVCIDCGQSKC